MYISVDARSLGRYSELGEFFFSFDGLYKNVVENVEAYFCTSIWYLYHILLYKYMVFISHIVRNFTFMKSILKSGKNDSVFVFPKKCNVIK